jgi:hypothetical protein
MVMNLGVPEDVGHFTNSRGSTGCSRRTAACSWCRYCGQLLAGSACPVAQCVGRQAVFVRRHTALHCSLSQTAAVFISVYQIQEKLYRVFQRESALLRKNVPSVEVPNLSGCEPLTIMAQEEHGILAVPRTVPV